MNMNDDKDMPEPLLAAHLDALRTELAGRDAPRCVEKELMQAFSRQFPKKRRWYQRLSPPQWGAAGALCSLSVVAMLLALSPHRAVTVGAPVLGLGMDKGAAFIALESLERIEQEPDTRVVEADLPRAALAPLGVPLDPASAAATVRAEMLVAADGHPLAVRLSDIQ